MSAEVALALQRTIKICMFDQYGTLVDMQSGLTAAITPYLHAKGWQGDPGRLVTWWRRAHFENSMIDALLHRAHLPYRAIGALSLAYTLDRANIAYTDDEVQSLVSCIAQLPPFPEVPAALERLGRRYQLAILSNGDPDMLDTARAYHGLHVDHMISVAVANAFKPHVATYTTAAEIVGVRLEEVLFVANHAFDCVGAKAAGMRTAFIDRRQRPFGRWPYQPDVIVPDMTALAAMMT